MKAGTIITLILTLLIGAGAVYVVKPELYEGILPDSMLGKKEVKKVRKKAAKKAVKKKEVKLADKAKDAPVKPAEPQKVEEPEETGEETVEEVAEDLEADAPDLPVKFKNQGIVKGEEWVDCAKVKEKVTAEILSLVKGKKAGEIAKIFRRPKNQLLLAQWVVADAELRSQEEVDAAKTGRQTQLEKARVDLENARAQVPAGAEPSVAVAWTIAQQEKKIAKLEKEEKSAHLFSESAKGKTGRQMMEQIGGDPQWLHDFAFSGECVRPGMALSILKEIYKQHPEMLGKRMIRDIATATALEYAKSGWNQQDAVERANFYINAWNDKRLNTVFDNLPMWQRRMVCGCKGDNAYGSVASLTWALDNFHLPVERFSGSCWRCSYRLNNIYGDSIHGPLYYAPFESQLGDNRAAMTYYIGGVCGSLSHFGAFAALANGVPAMTAGEPGHCSFLVLVGDKWTPAYSLSWERGLHWQVFRRVHTYSSLHAATELYSEKQEKDTQKSNIWRVLAGIHNDAGNWEEAEDCYAKAAKEQPRNYMAMREWREALEKVQSATPEHWNRLNDAVCEWLVPLYPELASEHMHKGLADGLAKNLAPEQLEKAYLKFWQNVKEMGPDRWRIEELGKKQLAAAGADKDVDKLCDFFSKVLGATVKNTEYAPAILSWGNVLGAELDTDGNGKLMQAIIDGIGKGGKMSSEDRVKLLAPAILAAEQNRDLAAFQAIAKMIKGCGYKNEEIKMPKIAPFPGKLASEDGLVWMSSTSPHDKPQDHAGLLTPEGGSFHTEKDTDAFIAVELPRQVQVTGVVIVATNGNLGRCNNMKVQVSENGNDWTDVHEFGTCDERVMRSDLNGRRPVAKYVRILRQGGPEFFHLNGIYIYGNPAA